MKHLRNGYGHEKTYQNVGRIGYGALLFYLCITLFVRLWLPYGFLELAVRIGSSLFFIALFTVLYFFTGLSRRVIAWVAPTLFFGVITAGAVIMNGDSLYLFIVITTIVVTFCFMDPRGFLTFLCIVIASMGLLLAVLKYPLMGASVPQDIAIIGFLAVSAIGAMLYFFSRYLLTIILDVEKSGSTFNSLMKTTFSHLVIINDDAVVEYLSDSLADWLDIGVKEHLRGIPLFDLLPPGEIRMLFHDILEKEGYVERHFTLEQNKVLSYYLLRSSQLNQGRIARIFEWTNITPIMEAKNLAESAARAKSNFLANMSHEIRTPMNAVVGMSELLLRGNLGEDERGYARDIKQAGDNLISIINDILDFSKIESGKMEIIPVNYMFPSLVNDTVNIIRIRLMEKPIRFYTNIEANIPNGLTGDETRMRQIILNLLSNAAKYTQRGT
ncbi:MAG: hypothetical protein LBD09_02420, partial [Treponema sp.]|nr:hypothetical protein [Treponema sp.]